MSRYPLADINTLPDDIKAKVLEVQAKAGFVECPTCGGTDVGKRLMAPAIPKKGTKRRREAPPQAAEGSGTEAPARVPAPPGSPPGGGMVSGPIPALAQNPALPPSAAPFQRALPRRSCPEP